MVFLRLEVKVIREAPSSGLLRSIEPRENHLQNEVHNLQSSSTSFLLTLDNPEEVTLGELAGLILDEWKTLRPDLPPLQIKKLVDDASPSVDLRLISTVADIFVNRGKAEADGHDQRSTVRVIPKPSTELPERFPSIVQDWEGAIRDAHRRKSTKNVTRFSPIREDDELLNGWKSSPVPHEFDIPGGPDNADPLGSPCDAIADTPTSPGARSEELGDSPSPATREPTPHPPFGSDIFRRASADRIDGSTEPVSASVTGSGILTITGIPTSHKRKRNLEQSPAGRQTRSRSHNSESMSPTSSSALHQPEPFLAINGNASRKRKQSPELDRPAKQPRIEANELSQKSPTPTPTSPPRRRVSAFSSPRRRVSISDESRHTPEHGLGLGITRSPQNSKKRMDDLASSQGPIKGPSFQSNTRADSSQTSEKPHPPSSALKKDSNTAPGRSQERRSVSFADSKDGHLDNTPTTSLAPKTGQVVPPSSQMSEMIWPPGFSQEQIEQFQKQAEKIAGERQDSGKAKFANRAQAKPRPTMETYKKSNPKRKATRHELLQEITSIEKKLRDSRIPKSKVVRAEFKERLRVAHEELQEEEAKSSKLEPSLPALETTVTRQIPENETVTRTSSRSLRSATSTREWSSSSTSQRQSGPLSAQDKSTNHLRGEPMKTARTPTPVSPSVHRSRSRSDSVGTSSRSNHSQEEQAKPISPPVEEEENSDTESSLDSQMYSESEMDVDAIEEQKGEDEDASSETQSSSDSDGSELQNDEDGKSEPKMQSPRVHNDQKEAHNPVSEKNMHLSVSKMPSESEDTSESSEHEEASSDSIAEEVQDHPVNGNQQNSNAQMPDEINEAIVFGVSGRSDNERNFGEDPATIQTNNEHPSQVNGLAPVLGDSTGSQPQADVQTQVNGQAPATLGELSDDSSEDSDDDSDDSDDTDSLPLSKELPNKSNTPVGSLNSMPANPQPPASTGMPVLQRTTLKGLLKAQKEESQRRQQQNQETRPQRSSGTTRDVYEVPSSRESKSSSSDDESEGGDIPHGGSGILSRLRSSWGGRK